jgi:hypothetical protein
MSRFFPAAESVPAVPLRFQNRPLGYVTDARGAFAAGAEGHTGRQARARFFQQPLREREGVGAALDARET